MRSQQWITRPGKLGGIGFLSKSPQVQHRLLNKCVDEYGYRSCLGSLMVLNRNRSIKRRHGKKIDKLKNWLKMKYGGPGSFGFRSKRKSRRKKAKRSKSKSRRKKAKRSKSKRKSRKKPRKRKRSKSKRKPRKRSKPKKKHNSGLRKRK